MFTPEQRGGFKYWMAHWAAYQMTALNLGAWKFKYLFHDVGKPWMMVWARVFHRSDPYGWVQKVHRSHSSHHLEHYQEWKAIHYDGHGHPHCDFSYGRLDIVAMLIDWECSRFTKTASPLNARQQFEHIRSSLSEHLQDRMELALYKLGL